MTTGQRIRAARKEAKMTQKDLANKLGISFVGVSQWERDIRNPKQETLCRIASALGVHWLDLAGDDYIDSPGVDVVDYVRNGIIFRPHTTPEREAAVSAAIEAGLREKRPDLFAYENELGYKALMRVDEAFTQLNDAGINEAVKRVEELTEIPRYQRQEPADNSVANHDANRDAPPCQQDGTDATPTEKPPESP